MSKYLNVETRDGAGRGEGLIRYGTERRNADRIGGTLTGERRREQQRRKKEYVIIPKQQGITATKKICVHMSKKKRRINKGNPGDRGGGKLPRGESTNDKRKGNNGG
ncbi:hypothetical protein WN55_04093 [Dufourea novaeangliae]|uniref:Uncharacterized protein n=1 Tax=Dufourea novaeangliae TaxID=178035 RepID=A0A154PKE9_DUFNO|nr:hypothetical protein WN55_04093 [Dufourea novaeangliae]